MLAMCAGFICSCNDDVEETPPATITPPDGNVTENKDTHEYVDLGLPSGTLWATCNVGASKPEESGDYFAWGETLPKSCYDWHTYKYNNYNYKTESEYDYMYYLTKYCITEDDGKVDNKTELEAIDDAATANWGSNWQTPDLEQFKELVNGEYTTTTWTDRNGFNGIKVISKINGRSIFLPASGYYNEKGIEKGSKNTGFYYSRSLVPNVKSYGSTHAYFLKFDEDKYDPSSFKLFCRQNGTSVRPVRVKN